MGSNKCVRVSNLLLAFVMFGFDCKGPLYDVETNKSPYVSKQNDECIMVAFSMLNCGEKNFP